MRTRIFLCLVLAASCSASGPRANEARPAQTAAQGPARTPLNEIRVRANGRPYAMRFEQGALAFCDAAGGHLVDVKTGQAAAAASLECTRDEPNIGCGGSSLDIDVRSPSSEPSDIVDVDGESYPLKGRVHDCAVFDKTVGLATSSNVVLIDTANTSIRQIDTHGADRLALSADWIAWSSGSNVSAAFRPTLNKLQRSR
jgi:hypothetical protein